MKMFTIILFTFLLFSTFAFGYEWDSFGPYGEIIYDFLFTDPIFCGVENGIMESALSGWISHDYSLPALELQPLDENNILMIMGNGSYSDGVYTFNIQTSEFQAVHSIYNPHFLIYNDSTTTYFAGGEYGLSQSANGENWEEIGFFQNKNCTSMVCSENNFLVTADNIIYYSDDFGSSWVETSPLLYPFCSFDVNNEGKIYAIFPDESYSSGLWSSLDYGTNWTVEFWDVLMNQVYIQEVIFVAWDNEGVGIWDSENEELTMLNAGLGCLEINNMENFPIINTPAMIVSTNAGGFYLTEYLNSSSQPPSISEGWNITISPNPFSNSTNIGYSIQSAQTIRLQIYNIKGKLVETLVDESVPAGQHQINWNRKKLSSGVYFIGLKGDGNNHLKAVEKVVLMN